MLRRILHVSIFSLSLILSSQLLAHRNLAVELDGKAIFWVRSSPAKSDTLILEKAKEPPTSPFTPQVNKIEISSCTAYQDNPSLLQINSENRCVYLKHPKGSWRLKETIEYTQRVIQQRDGITDRPGEHLLTYPFFSLMTSSEILRHIYLLLQQWPVINSYCDPRSWTLTCMIVSHCLPCHFRLQLPKVKTNGHYLINDHVATTFNQGGVAGIQLYTRAGFQSLKAAIVFTTPDFETIEMALAGVSVPADFFSNPLADHHPSAAKGSSDLNKKKK
ncbi:hypothetical protein [Spongorhabdus nitratireducens]